MFGCIAILIIRDLSLAIQSEIHLSYQRQPQHYETMLSTALGFPKDKRVTDHYSILEPEAVGFSQGMLQHELNRNTEQMVKLSFINL